jgi:acyl carrier protein
MAELTSDSVLAELQPIFHEALDSPGLKITRSSSALNTPNWDSLAHISIVEMVETHFKIHIGISELEDLKQVGDLVDLIVAKAGKS